MKLERLVITCGGTGGHFYPGLSVAREFCRQGGEVRLLLSGGHASRQRQIAEAAGIPAVELPTMPSPGSPVKAAKFLRGLASGITEARRELKQFHPQAAVGMGSFASLPVLLAAQWAGIPRFLHDGNARVGRANRWLGRSARFLATAFPAVNGAQCGAARLICTGMPVRPELEAASGIRKEEAFRGLNAEFGTALTPELPTILVFGGSQGAAVFNRTVPAALKQLGRSDFQVLHLAGPGKCDETRKNYAGAGFSTLVLPGSERMEWFLGAADLVLSRSGGSTVAELALFGKAAILIPYPYAAELHQDDNARYLSDNGAAELVPNEIFTEARAVELLMDFMENRQPWRVRGECAAALAKPGAAAVLLAEISRELLH